MEDKSIILSWIDENKNIFLETAKELWNNPELSMQEYYAADTLTRLLERLGFSVERGLAGMPTSFIASWGEGDPVFAFSSEYDALPGLSQQAGSTFHDPIVEGGPGHGCGHNLMAVGGILAAVGLKKIMESKNKTGTIKIFGTPAEEICVGKTFFARDGYFDHVDIFFDWHPSHLNRGAACATNAYFNVKYHFTGKTAHGNAPWVGRSALDAAMLTGHAIEMLREHVKPGTGGAPTTLNYAFPDVGNSFPNVVPDKALLWCVGRMEDAEIAADVLSRVNACAEGCAIATETSVRIEVTTATHDMIPNETMARVIEKNLKEIGVPAYSDRDQEAAQSVQRAMGIMDTGYKSDIEAVQIGLQPVTDASEYSWFAPLAFLNMGLSPSEDVGWHNWAVTKFAGSDVGEKVLVAAAKVLAATAFDVLLDSSILKDAKGEWKKRLNGQVYQSLLPAGSQPDVETNKDLMERFRAYRR